MVSLVVPGSNFNEIFKKILDPRTEMSHLPLSNSEEGGGVVGGCSSPATHQSGRSSLLNVLRGTCDLSVHGMGVF